MTRQFKHWRTGMAASLLFALTVPAHAGMLLGYALGQASCDNHPAPTITNAVPNDGFVRIKTSYTTP